MGSSVASGKELDHVFFSSRSPIAVAMVLFSSSELESCNKEENARDYTSVTREQADGINSPLTVYNDADESCWESETSKE